jgi:hypothetical protein
MHLLSECIVGAENRVPRIGGEHNRHLEEDERTVENSAQVSGLLRTGESR